MRHLLLSAGFLVLMASYGFAQEPGLAESLPLPSAGELALPQGDPERGRLVFGRCRGCHFTDPHVGHGNGPNLHRIFGQVAGKQAGFAHYSPELQAAQFVWTPSVLYVWLENPMAAMPGTTMMSAGVPEPQQRADLVAYLALVTVRTFPD